VRRGCRWWRPRRRSRPSSRSGHRPGRGRTSARPRARRRRATPAPAPCPQVGARSCASHADSFVRMTAATLQEACAGFLQRCRRTPVKLATGQLRDNHLPAGKSTAAPGLQAHHGHLTSHYPCFAADAAAPAGPVRCVRAHRADGPNSSVPPRPAPDMLCIVEKPASLKYARPTAPQPTATAPRARRDPPKGGPR
jgi:hypothetical protein